MDNVLFVMKSVHGSHLYGTNTPASDKDFKGIFVHRDCRDIFLRRAAKMISKSTGNDQSKNTAADIDLDYFEILTFIEELAAGETICIDMIHTPDDLIELNPMLSYIWTDLQRNRHKFYTKNMKSLIGYAKRQAAKYGLKGSRMGALEEILIALPEPLGFTEQRLVEYVDKLPQNEHAKFVRDETVTPVREYYEVLGSKYQLTVPYKQFYRQIKAKWDEYGERARLAKDNQGIDWKAVSHAIRAAYQLREIFQTTDLKYPLKDAPYLLKVKTGQLDFLTEVQPELERAIAEVEKLSEVSLFPEKVDLAFWHDKVIGWYQNIYGINSTQYNPLNEARFVG